MMDGEIGRGLAMRGISIARSKVAKDGRRLGVAVDLAAGPRDFGDLETG